MFKYYYYSTVESYMRSQAKYSQETYMSYLSDYSLEEAIVEDKDQFYRNTDLQVQVLDNSGRVLLDSLGTGLVGEIMDTEDVNMVKSGSSGRSVYKPSYDNHRIMAFSAPLENRNEQIGIIRIISSLQSVDYMIIKSSVLAIFIGLIFNFFMFIVSMRISKSIVRPINELTDLAEDLAQGDFDKKAVVRSNDEIGKLAYTINFMIENVNEKEQLKNEFISSTSHELRTPLTSIKGWSVTLQDGQKDPLVKEGLSIIESETDRLQEMLEDLLDFSSYTTGKVRLTLEKVDLISLCQNMVKQLTPRAKNNGIEIVLNYDKDHLWAMLDLNKIKQVLINLIDNAIKFTEEDGVVILNVYEENDYNIIEVIDTGIGISEDEIKFITDKFYKGKHSNSHMGLGFSICEEIIDLHKGNMVIESVLGEGTKIKLSIPKGDIDEEK